MGEGESTYRRWHARVSYFQECPGEDFLSFPRLALLQAPSDRSEPGPLDFVQHDDTGASRESIAGLHFVLDLNTRVKSYPLRGRVLSPR